MLLCLQEYFLCDVAVTFVQGYSPGSLLEQFLAPGTPHEIPASQPPSFIYFLLGFNTSTSILILTAFTGTQYRKCKAGERRGVRFLELQ